MRDSSDSNASILFDFVDQLMHDLEAGRALPLGHYLARFPGHEESVAREFLALTTARTEDAAQAGKEERTPDHIGPYRVVRVLGSGGQGVVYCAEDLRLERTVALKVLSFPAASVSQARRNRFRREAEIVSRLDHPGLCTVLDADLDGATPYIAMRYVEGETLAGALHRTRAARESAHGAAGTPAPGGAQVLDSALESAREAGRESAGASTSASRLLAPRNALELAQTLAFFEAAARALHAAHEAGVVHRDVKPGNIMVSTEGAPVILDFGLARDADQESMHLTRSGEVFGTPAYISPEQLQSGRDVDRRTDVYSLGVVLYECLTLERPFQAGSNAELAQAIRNAPMPPPRRSNPAVPHDLAVVLETALEKDVERRYPTAIELAEELRRVREYVPIHARPAGPALRLLRWSQRNPILATGTIGSIVALTVALIVALVLLERVRQEERRKDAALELYEGAWYRDLAASSLASSPPRSLHFAIAAAERDPGLASNRVLLAALDSMHEKQVLVGHRIMVMQVDIDRPSRRVLTASYDGTARVWDAQSGEELCRFTGTKGAVLHARFDPAGERVVTTGLDGQLCIWRIAQPEAPELVLSGHAGDVHWAEFSSDGTRVISASRDRTARVWDARDGRELARLSGHAGSVAEARFVDADRLVLTRSAEPLVGAVEQESDFSARLFDAQTGAQLSVFAGHQAAVVSFDASSDLRWLVTASEDKSARLWELDRERAEPRAVRVYDAPGKFHSACFSPDARSLALAWDAGAKVLDVASGELRYMLPNHEHRAVVRIAFSPNGKELATIAYDDAMRVFDAASGALIRMCRGDTRQLSGLRWSPDSSFLVTWQRLPTVDLWYGATRPFLQVLRGHAGEVRSASFDRQGERLLSAASDGTARTWNVQAAELERAFDPRSAGREPTPLVAACFDHAGRRIATTDERGRVALWDAHEGVQLSTWDAGGATGVAASFSPDGTRLLFAEPGGTALLVDLASGTSKRLRSHTDELACARFSDDGTRIATGAHDRCVCLWDAGFSAADVAAARSAGAPLESKPLWHSEPFAASLYTLRAVFDVALSPDGRWVAAACQNVCIELLDARDGRVCNVAPGATQGHLAFSGDGRLLMGTSKYLNFATAWRIEEEGGEGRLVRVLLRDVAGYQHINSVTSLAIARDAPRMVTGSLDRTARLWDIEARECIATFAGHAERVLDADITHDGRWIATASSDGTLRLWPGDPLEIAKRYEPSAYARTFGPLPTPEKRE